MCMQPGIGATFGALTTNLGTGVDPSEMGCQGETHHLVGRVIAPSSPIARSKFASGASCGNQPSALCAAPTVVIPLPDMALLVLRRYS